MLHSRFLSTGKKTWLSIASAAAMMVLITGSFTGIFKSATAAGTGSGLRAEYFSGYGFDSSRFVRTDSSVNFDWRFGSPDSSLSSDGFSVRWTGQVEPMFSEAYTFYTVADDGVRLSVNGQKIIDNWTDHAWVENSGIIPLVGGQKYNLTMEYYEKTGSAVAKIAWSSPSQAKEFIPQSQLYPAVGSAIVNAPIASAAQPSQPAQQPSPAPSNGSGLRGEYFSDVNFQAMKLSRTDSTVSFDWGGNAPEGNLAPDNFSVRWTGQVMPKFSEAYTFRTVSDDGVRLWVNGQSLINNWSDHSRKEDFGTVNLTAGQKYDIKMEYYERSGGAVAQLLWSSPSQQREVIPFSQLFPSASASVPVTSPALPYPSPANPTVSTGNPFAGAKLYVNPYNDPKRWADANRSSRPSDAALMDKIAKQSESVWLGDWNPNPQQDANNFTNNIVAQGALPVFVLYNVPLRDCGSYSAGGAQSPDAYRAWVRGVAAGIGDRKAAVILEPDGLSNIDCMSQADQTTRVSLIREAVQILNAAGNISVYIDAGNPNWIPADVMANRLKAAGIDQARGFALSISNFITDSVNVEYGTRISQLTGGKHFVAERSRNGLGPTPDFQWCNPSGRALGLPPTTNTGNSLVDAFLWVKGPGGSDGQCNGGPAAGVFWPDYALGLAQRASW